MNREVGTWEIIMLSECKTKFQLTHKQGQLKAEAHVATMENELYMRN